MAKRQFVPISRPGFDSRRQSLTPPKNSMRSAVMYNSHRPQPPSDFSRSNLTRSMRQPVDRYDTSGQFFRSQRLEVPEQDYTMSKSARAFGNSSVYGSYGREGFFNSTRNLNIQQRSPLSYPSNSLPYKNQPFFNNYNSRIQPSLMPPIQRKPSPDKMELDE
jgi:hypothetical protein